MLSAVRSKSPRMPALTSGDMSRDLPCAQFPRDFRITGNRMVDICLILKEHPTLAIDFTASIQGEGNVGDLLKAIAKTIVINGGLVGERVFADVVTDDDVVSLYVTRPYMETGLLTIHFAAPQAARDN
jgi:hypothetical protein